MGFEELRDYAFVKDVIHKMVRPDSNQVEVLFNWNGVPVYFDPKEDICNEKHWAIFDTLWNYYCDYGIIVDLLEAETYYSLICYELQGMWVSYNLPDFWDDADGRGLYSWVEREWINDPLVGIHFDKENQFQIVNELSLYNFISFRISIAAPFKHYCDNNDHEDLLWAVGEMCKINSKHYVPFLETLYGYWKWDWHDMNKEIHDMYSEFFAEPHVPWPY